MGKLGVLLGLGLAALSMACTVVFVGNMGLGFVWVYAVAGGLLEAVKFTMPTMLTTTSRGWLMRSIGGLFFALLVILSLFATVGTLDKSTKAGKTTDAELSVARDRYALELQLANGKANATDVQTSHDKATIALKSIEKLEREMVSLNVSGASLIAAEASRQTETIGKYGTVIFIAMAILIDGLALWLLTPQPSPAVGKGVPDVSQKTDPPVPMVFPEVSHISQPLSAPVDVSQPEASPETSPETFPGNISQPLPDISLADQVREAILSGQIKPTASAVRGLIGKRHSVAKEILESLHNDGSLKKLTVPS